MTLAELQAQVAAFVAARDWQPFHTPRNLAVSLSIEAAELLQHFQWFDNEQSRAQLADPATRAAVAAELADVLIYALSFAEAAGIDPTEAIRAKLARNEQRFPVAQVRGRFGARPGGGHLAADAPGGEEDPPPPEG